MSCESDSHRIALVPMSMMKNEGRDVLADVVVVC